jgi:uncharacterized protein
MIILGFIAAIIIGISLGLIGGGGSILTVPAMVYLMDIDPVLATSYSLFVVGTTSLIGGVSKYFKKETDIKTFIIFGIPSVISVFATRMFIVPAIPDEILTIGVFHLSKSVFILLLFAILMVLAAFSMIRNGRNEVVETINFKDRKFNYPLILGEGVIVGLLTGLVGAGGGFLIIPALVILSKLPMKLAVGTSLLIIAAKSLIGFTGDISHYDMDWKLLSIFTGLSVAGIFVGNYLSNLINGEKLKKGFGWFVLIMGTYIIIHEIMTSINNINH